MKILCCVAFLAIPCLSISGCKSSGDANMAAVKEYQCSGCKETVKWTTQPGKPWITSGKEVVHTCPECKTVWVSNVSSTSTCAMCADANLKCPICMAKH